MIVARIWFWRLLAAAGLTILVVTTTARLTLLDPHFDARSVASADGYERIYSQILPSAAVQDDLREALQGLPIDPTYVTANVRVLLPPSVLQSFLTDLTSSYVDVLVGNADRVNIAHALQPVVDHVVLVVEELLPGALATAPHVTTKSLAAFSTDVQSLLVHLERGNVSLSLPTVHLGAKDVARVAKILTAGLPADAASELRTRLTPILATGNLTSAFAIVVPAYVDASVARELAITANGGLGLLADTVPSQLAIAHPRTLLPLGLGWLTAIGALLAAAAVRPLLTRRGRRSAQIAHIATTFAVATGAALLVGIALWQLAVDPLRRLGEGDSLPPAARQLVLDVDDQLRLGISRTFLALTGVLALVALIGLAAAHLPGALRRGRDRARAGIVVALGAAALVIVAVPPGHPGLTCNGSARLCNRAYNDVTYLTSHNAMASSDRGFLGAEQDPSIIGQLDGGVRALMLDLHYWTTSEEATAFLSGQDAKTRSALGPLVRSLQSRPGVWLCHNICQLGADSAQSQLSALRVWLGQHPDDVVTLILQDDVSADDVRATIKAAGLGPRLATPPAPGKAWPTLGHLIGSGHTLFVFTQSDAFTSGPIRSFYQLASETAYTATSVADLSCDPGRGALTAPLFLVNNWITTSTPSRSAALKVNSPRFLLNRVVQCEQQRGMRANFVAVDFAQTGQPLQVVDALNSMPPPEPDTSSPYAAPTG